MAIIPTIRCSSMRASLAFYTGVLDFEHVDGDGDLGDPSFSVLARDGDRLFLSSHTGDGEFGQAVVVTTDEGRQVLEALDEPVLVNPGRSLEWSVSTATALTSPPPEEADVETVVRGGRWAEACS